MASSSSFNLPINPTSTPSAPGTGNGFLQPSGVTIGPPSGGFGGVSGTIPANTSQSSVNTRAQVRFQVQPQVTIAVNPTYPLSEEVRRKDFLMALHDPKNTTKRRNVYGGTPVIGLKQVNEALKQLANGGDDLSGPAQFIQRALDDFRGDATRVSDVIQVLQPFGVYNNRGTHNAQEAFQYTTNASTREIIGVNISNYCFMRDIFGVDLRQGDTMELHCLYNGEERCVEFVPVIREHAYTTTIDGTNLNKLIDNGKTYRFCLGKVWVTPLHGPFNGREINIVGHQNSEANRFGNFGNSTNPMEIYRNIEVELSPSFLCNQAIKT